jgi:hypothetical protein
MAGHPELEISLHQRDTHSYAIALRFSRPDEETELLAEAFPVRFDHEKMRDCHQDIAAYGRLLGESLFAHPEVRTCLGKARALAQSKSQQLRLRLCIDRWSTVLHALNWETLRDPDTGRSLVMDDNVWFSRHLASFDMRPVRLRSRTDLRALVAVANPSDLDRYKPGGRRLAAVQVKVEDIEQSLTPMVPAEFGPGEPVTLDAILKRLQDDYDVLYLVCHGALVEGEPRLWLQDDSGSACVVAATDMVDGLARLLRLPRLIVLASCQSAGKGDDAYSDDEGVLAALGPRLAEVGVPAVVAMQGNVSQRTVSRFMPIFFRELMRDGQIDRAMTDARFAVRDEPDYWVPVLFTRLVNGRLWYEQRLTGATPGFDAWEGLLKGIRNQRCVPILGSGLLDPFVGSTRDLARRWAQRSRYPLAAAFQEQLPQVAQFLSTTQGPDYPRDLYVDDLTAEICRRWPAAVTKTPMGPDEPASQYLSRLLSTVGTLLAETAPVETHRLLADLPCRLYVSTNPDTLLRDALSVAGKTPRVELCRWRELDDAVGNEPAAMRARSPNPTVAAPLVFQMFGHLEEAESLVLTEDDYFNYLINVVRLQSRPTPSFINDQLTRSYLMLLGFRIDDWDFRVFFNLLMSQQGASLLAGKPHVAVQFDPEDGRSSEPGRARRFLERYFQKAQVSIYWGSVEDFMQEFSKLWHS